jgi:hypothetical protein
MAFFLSDGNFVEALRLGLTFFQNKAPATHGLPPNLKERQRLIAEEMMDKLRAYADLSLASPAADQAAFFRKVIALSIDYCIYLKIT